MKFWRVPFDSTIVSGRCAAILERKAAPRLSLFVIILIGLCNTQLSAQDTNQIEQLKKQLQDMQDNFERFSASNGNNRNAQPETGRAHQTAGGRS